MNSQVRIIYTDTQDAHSYMITSKLEVNWSTQPLETWHKNTTWFQESQACEQFDPAKLSLKQQRKRTILNFNSVPTSLQQAAHASSRQGHWNHQAYRSERIQNNDETPFPNPGQGKVYKLCRGDRHIPDSDHTAMCSVFKWAAAHPIYM